MFVPWVMNFTVNTKVIIPTVLLQWNYYFCINNKTLLTCSLLLSFNCYFNEPDLVLLLYTLKIIRYSAFQGHHLVIIGEDNIDLPLLSVMTFAMFEFIHRCVMKMDHHCPWINNCVGHLNHRSFTLFLCLVPFGCTHATLIMVCTLVQQFYLVSVSFGI